MRLYIRSTACISPQKTFGDNGFLTDVVEYHDTRLKAIEPDYSGYIDNKSARRMSHVVKMGVASALECMKQIGVEMPGAIITGTALGCVEDTVTFLTRIIELNEEMLPPTAFIQSTHNTIAAQVALMLKCHAYNNNFVHKGISFESALQDAMMLLKEGDANDILVGGIEELTDTSFKVLTRLGLYKRQPLSNLSLFDTVSNGSIAGEGATFFLVSDKSSVDNLAELSDLKMFYGVSDAAELERRVVVFLSENGLDISNIDLIITGRNGDTKNDETYNKLTLFKDKAQANYKHLCGEYPVSSSFALWLASNIVYTGTVPAVVGGHGVVSPKKVLIYNHYQNMYHSLMLISSAN